MQIGNKLTIIPACDVSWVSSTEIALLRSDRKVTLSSTGDIELSSTPSRTDAGNLYSYQIVAAFDKFDGWKNISSQALILQINKTDYTKQYVGTKDLPVRGSFKEYPDKLQVTFTFKSTIPLF